MEISTGLTIFGGAVGSAKVIERILGPTADYLGKGLEGWVKNRVNNVARIFSNAEEKLGEKIEETGGVPPKILSILLYQGSYIEDELILQYFGGVLASSRTPDGKDDRGAAYMTLTSQLSTFQIRSHYIFYFLFKKVFEKTNLEIQEREHRDKMLLFITYREYAKSLNIEYDENNFFSIFEHAFNGLRRNDLVVSNFIGGHKVFNIWMKENYNIDTSVDEPGFLIAPSWFGAEYFMWSHGYGMLGVPKFLKDNFKVKPLENIYYPKYLLINA